MLKIFLVLDFIANIVLAFLSMPQNNPTLFVTSLLRLLIDGAILSFVGNTEYALTQHENDIREIKSKMNLEEFKKQTERKNFNQ